jgi:hypothetical protein
MRLISVLVGFAVVGAAAVTCGSAHGLPPRYPAAASAQLNASCASAMVGALGPRRAAAFCSCVVQKLQANVPHEDAAAFFTANNNRGHPMPTPAIVGALNGCKGAAG